jgi:UPF0271 protein
MPPEDIVSGMLYQLGALDAIVRAEGGRLRHVKPHGALYNQAAKDAVLANAICAAIRTFNPELSLYGLAGSELIAAARHADLNAVEEVFADRAYEADGSLVARSKPGAMIENDQDAIAQTLMLVKQKQVKAIDGSLVSVNAQTVCLHGDGAHALDFARQIRARLHEERIAVRATA